MSDPKDADDPWADLYRDLEVDAASAKPAEPIESADEAEAVEFAEQVETDAEGEFEAEDEGDAPAGEENGQPGEEGPKKRRRRRRRRKKKGGLLGEGGEAVSQPDATDAEPEAIAEADETGEDEPEAYEPEGVEDGSPETAREVIANWNVPSWPEIVAGLYRPDRG